MSFKDFWNKNKYLSKEQQIKRSFVKGTLIGFGVVLVVIGVYQFIVIPEVKENEKILVMNDIKKSQSRNLYAVKEKNGLKQGHIITMSDIETIKLPQELTPSDSVTDESKLLGKELRMDLGQNNVFTKSVITSQDDAVTSDLRKQDYDHIVLNYNLKVGDYVDIRIRYKDGTDYRVATKKRILSLNGNKAVYQISEDEREFINNATVIAAIKGGVLYTTIYKDPQNQPAAEVNYTLDTSVKNLIESNPNIVRNAQDQLRQNISSTPSNNNTKQVNNGTSNTNNTQN